MGTTEKKMGETRPSPSNPLFFAHCDTLTHPTAQSSLIFFLAGSLPSIIVQFYLA